MWVSSEYWLVKVSLVIDAYCYLQPEGSWLLTQNPRFFLAMLCAWAFVLSVLCSPNKTVELEV